MFDTVPKIKDGCEKTYTYVKCAYEFNPENFSFA